MSFHILVRQYIGDMPMNPNDKDIQVVKST